MNLCEAIFHTENIPELVFRIKNNYEFFYWVKNYEIWYWHGQVLNIAQFDYKLLKADYEIVDRTLAIKEANLIHKATLRRLRRKK